MHHHFCIVYRYTTNQWDDVTLLKGVNIRSGCFGETSDCSYAISDEILRADRPFVALFVGADHRRLGNSAFSNIAVYHSGEDTRSLIPPKLC